MQNKYYAIHLAEHSGFCFGVKNATEKIEKAINDRAVGARIFTLGQLIHNDTYIQKLRKYGVESIENDDKALIDLAKSATKDAPVSLFLRAHGVPAETDALLKRLSAENPYFTFVDCTCPFVKKIHRIAEDNSRADNADPDERVFILIGSEAHPEVIGIMSYYLGKKYVFSNYNELLESLKDGELSKLHKFTPIMAAQTTLNLSEWQNCQKLLKSICTNAIIFDTICSVTEKRQSETKLLSDSCDVMIVIGGRHSSNTAKLYSICKENCDQSYLIESSADLDSVVPKHIYRQKAETRINIGIVAGASTPCDIIQEVIKTMSENFETREVENFEELLDSSIRTLNIGDIVVGTVTSVTDAELQLDIKAKNTGVIPADQIADDNSIKLTEMFKVGDEVEGFVTRVSDVDGFAYLSKKRVDSDKSWFKVAACKDSGEVLEGKVLEAVKGGLVVLTDSVKVFVPASQSGVPMGGDLSTLVGETVKFKIIDIKPGKKAVGSIRTVLADERRARVAEFWNNIEEGKVYNGIVKNLTKYGAFVDLGGVDGLILVSELTWKRVSSPADVIAVGDELSVYVKSFDKEKGRIVLGHKTEETNPWYIFTHNYTVGDVVNVKIVNTVEFGAFAEIIDGVDGLIHITQIANERIASVAAVLSVGQEVDAKIIAIDTEKKKVSLSIRALLAVEEPVAAEEAVEEVAEETEATAEADAE